ncbi:general transcription factor II-I repeat domain-containing protein 2A [Trichonephila clavipes]|nr:general transcription factor II-I repeat domain-containing protein 2A [Trichonephila clavipes]
MILIIKISQRIKDVPLSRNTMKDRILKLAENVTDQQKNDINSAPFISLWLDESIVITKSARLAVFARYCVENIIKEELIAITSLLTTTKGTDICTAWYWDRTHDMPAMVGYLNHWATAAPSPRQDKIICSMQTLPRSSTYAQSHLGMPNRCNKVTKNGNGPSEGLFAGNPVQP